MLQKQNHLPLAWVTPASASTEAILRAHAPEILERLQEPRDFDSDTPYFEKVGDYARASAGAALAGLTLALAGEPSFSLMRPPGHHATRNQSMGFCYLNNIAIAALAARTEGCKRVAVFDFDVHHGNGTEDILLDQPGMAFFSVHQSPAYPGTGLANRGNNAFNFCVPPSVPRETYLAMLQRALDALCCFQPDMVAVSAGFDAYRRDPLAQGSLEEEDYHWLGRRLGTLEAPLFSLLEGGYSRDLPKLILAYLEGLGSAR